jgi:hypothetical protein
MQRFIETIRKVLSDPDAVVFWFLIAIVGIAIAQGWILSTVTAPRLGDSSGSSSPGYAITVAPGADAVTSPSTTTAPSALKSATEDSGLLSLEPSAADAAVSHHWEIYLRRRENKEVWL